MNNLKTFLLMTGLMGLCLWIGHSLGGQQGMIMAFGMATVMNFASYWWSDKIVLVMHRAKPLTEAEAPEIHSIVRTLCMSANIPMPKVYRVPSPIPNAFATGRNPHHAAVAVTDGILEILTREELQGVLGHELAHVQNRDILISTIAATFAGAIMMIARMAQWAAFFGGSRNSNDREGSNPLALLVAIVIAPLAATLIQLAISRSREFQADAHGAKISGDPMALARALQKLQAAGKRMPMSLGTQTTAHLYIVNPLRGADLFMKLFSTHPPMEERVRRLEAMR